MISAIILTKNEEQMIDNCINSCKQVADEIIVVDNGSDDKTVEIAMHKGAKVEFSNDPSFAKRREIGAKAARGDWLVYVDADERITGELAQELKKTCQNPQASDAYVLNRKDYYFGQPRPLFSPMHRFFKKSSLQGWNGDLHESPLVSGNTGYLQNYLIHFTHVDIDSMLRNTLQWSTLEASLRYKAHHPPVLWWRLVRVFLTGFWNSFVTQKGYSCGTAGWVEAMYQGCSLFLTYAKLWEMQNSDSIKKAYQQLDSQFTK